MPFKPNLNTLIDESGNVTVPARLTIGTSNATVLASGGVIDFAAYGACDGVTDDSAAFASALAAIPSPGGGTIRFPHGKTCYFASGLSWSDRPVTLEGYGQGLQPTAGAVLKFAAGVTGITMQNGSGGLGAGSTIRNLRIQGSDTGAGSNSGVVVQCHAGAVDNCTIKSFGGYGLLVDSQNGSVPYNTANTLITRTKAYGNYTGGIKNTGGASNAVWFFGVSADQNTGYGITEEGYSNVWLAHTASNSTGHLLVQGAASGNVITLYTENDSHSPSVVITGAGRHQINLQTLSSESQISDGGSTKSDIWVTGHRYNPVYYGTPSGTNYIAIGDQGSSLGLSLFGFDMRMRSPDGTKVWNWTNNNAGTISVSSAQGGNFLVQNPLVAQGAFTLSASAASTITNVAAPATPASGKSAFYFDSTSKNIASKNDAGTVNHGVQTKAVAANTFLSAISDDGSVSAALVTFGSAVPTLSNGQVAISLTNDTTVTITAKGSDGVTRTATVTLA